jgi:hypothetical protein
MGFHPVTVVNNGNGNGFGFNNVNDSQYIEKKI